MLNENIYGSDIQKKNSYILYVKYAKTTSVSALHYFPRLLVCPEKALKVMADECDAAGSTWVNYACTKIFSGF